MLKINKILFLKTYISVFILLCISFFVLISLVNRVFYHLPGLYSSLSDGHRGEIEYNTLLASRGSGDATLLSSPSRVRDIDRLELLADTLYVQSGSLERVRGYYTDALTYERRKRIEDKLALIESSSTNLSGSISSQTADTGTISTGETIDRYRDDIENAKIRINEDAQKRGSYIQNTQDTKIIKDTIDFLDLGIERVDW